MVINNDFHALCGGMGCSKCMPVKLFIKCPMNDCDGVLEVQSHGVSCDTCNNLFEHIDKRMIVNIGYEFVNLYKKYDLLDRRIRLLENINVDKIGFDEDDS